MFGLLSCNTINPMPKGRSILKYVIHRDTSFSNIMFSANVLFKYMKKNNSWGTIGAYDVYDRWKINDTIGFDYVYLDDYLLFEVDSNLYAIKHDRMAGDTLLVVAQASLVFFSRSGEPIPEKEIQYKFFYDSVVVLSKDTTNIHFYFKR